MPEFSDEQSDLKAPALTEDDRRTTKRKKHLIWLIALPLLLLTGVLLLYRAFRADSTTPARENPPAMAAGESGQAAGDNQVQFSAAALARANIETEEVALRSLPRELEASGRLTINEDASARVGTPSEGRVTKVMATVGDNVKAGQILVLVHSHELVQAQADYARAVAGLTRAEKSLAYAQAELERASRLLAAKAVSEREQLRAAADVTAATAEVEQLKVELRRADEYLEHLGVRPGGPDDVVIRAPLSGVVTRRNVSVGTVVSPAEDLMVIANLATLWAIAEVPEKQAAAVGPGQQASLTVQAYPDRVFSGRVVHLGTSLNPEMRTVQVRCLVANPRGQLRPEMFAAVRLATGVSQQMLAVPRGAVQEVRGEKVVFIPVDAGVFAKRSVQTGREQGDWIEIVSGLEAGERVVTLGSFFIKSEFLKGTISDE